MDNFDFNLEEKSKKNDIYFSNEVNQSTQSAGSASPAPKSRGTAKVKRKSKGVGSTYLFFIIVIVVSMVVSIYAILCMNDILAITKTQSSVTITFTQEVKESSDAIDALAENGLIKCKNFCKLFAVVRDKVIKNSKIGGPYEAGVYYLNGKMGLEGMLVTLQGTTKTSETVKLIFPEGLTVPEIVEKLSENDVCDKSALLSVIQSTSFSYSLVSDLKASDSIPYRLEGFLFPDTYEFYVDESASSTIKKFLENGDKKFTKKNREKAKKMGLSTYEVMTIASIIQKEAANNSQMKTISAIIHNRLKDKVNFPSLGCQSTSDYITNKVAPALSSTSAHTSEYYMTYYNTNTTSTVVGLPAGPICNPGKAAINAALNPSDSKAKFFFHDADGNMYTAKTYQEFKDKVAKYAPYLNA